MPRALSPRSTPQPVRYNSVLRRALLMSTGTAQRLRSTLITRIADIVGAQGLITDPSEMEPYVLDWRGIYRGATPAVVRPASAQEVAAVVKLCAESATAI